MIMWLWDYDVNKLRKTKSGRLLILERQINYGVSSSDNEKIDLKEVKRHWNELILDPLKKRLMKLLIWGK